MKTSSAGRRTNLALLLLLPVAALTGLAANAVGAEWALHPSVAHGVVGLAILVLSPWKQVIARRGLRKRRPTAWTSLALLAMVLTALATGLAHVFGYTGRIGPLTLMQAHIGAGLLALPLAAVHYRDHPVRPQPRVDLSRRALLRVGVLGVAATTIWAALEGSLDAMGLAGGDRRFTGSHERASHDAARLPVTSWLDDAVQEIDPAGWKLVIDEVTLTHGDVASLPHETFDAVLDCTSAWFSKQTWTGVRLSQIVDAGSRRSLLVRSQTGYSRRFPARDLDRLWLVTHVGGRPLSSGHGFPARIVAPGRRGFWWVKWVTEIRTSDVPWWLQLPFPAT